MDEKKYRWEHPLWRTVQYLLLAIIVICILAMLATILDFVLTWSWDRERIMDTCIYILLSAAGAVLYYILMKRIISCPISVYGGYFLSGIHLMAYVTPIILIYMMIAEYIHYLNDIANLVFIVFLLAGAWFLMKNDPVRLMRQKYYPDKVFHDRYEL